MWSEGLSSWYLDIAKIPDMTARSPTRWAVYSSCGSLRGHGISASEALLAGHSVTQVFRWNSEAMLQQLENSRLLTCSRPLHVVCVCVNVGSFLLHLENLFDSLLCSELRRPCNEPSLDGWSSFVLTGQAFHQWPISYRTIAYRLGWRKCKSWENRLDNFE